MTDSMLLFVAIAVFSLMLIGVVLTILEFSRGAPQQQDEKARKEHTSDSADRSR